MKTIIIILVIAMVGWWILGIASSIWLDRGVQRVPQKSKRQLRIEKHSWDRDEYWVAGALLFLLLIKLFSK